MVNRAEFLRVLLATWAAFTSAQPLSDPAIEAYWAGLQDLDYEDFKTGAMRAIRECRFFPTVAELRHFSRQSPDERAVLAWDVIRRGIKTGVFTGPHLFVFDDPVLTATVANLGGCKRFADVEGNDLHKWLRDDFERVYQVMHAASIDPRRVEHLAGIGRHQLAEKDRDERVHVLKTRLPWALDHRDLAIEHTPAAKLPAVQFQKVQ
jgi:hypothetical protein